MSIWLAIAGMALVTYLTRAAGFVLVRGDIPAWLLRWLSYVPAAVFTALALPALLVRSGEAPAQLALGPAAVAGAAGALAAWRGGGVVLTIAAGLLAYWALRWLGWQ